MGRKKVFSSVKAGEELLEAMASAIRNITEEIKKPVDSELSGSNRRAELKLENMIKELKETGGIEQTGDFSGGFSERYAER